MVLPSFITALALGLDILFPHSQHPVRRVLLLLQIIPACPMILNLSRKETETGASGSMYYNLRRIRHKNYAITIPAPRRAVGGVGDEDGVERGSDDTRKDARLHDTRSTTHGAPHGVPGIEGGRACRLGGERITCHQTRGRGALCRTRRSRRSLRATRLD